MNTDMKYRPVTYIGPTVIKYGLFKNKTFKGGIPYRPLKVYLINARFLADCL